jgi:hypothetical protein
LSGGGFFLARYNPDGTLFSATSATPVGTVTSRGLAAAADGGAIAVGEFTGTITFGAAPALVALGAPNAFVVKYAAGGTTVAWARSVAGLLNTSTARAAAVATFADNSSVVTGDFSGQVAFGAGSTPPTLTAAGARDVFAARYDANGTPRWQAQAGTAAATGSGLGVVTYAVDGSLAVVGKFSPTFVFGSTNLTSAGSGDVFIARYAGNGAFLSAKSAGGTGDDSAAAVSGFSDTGAIVIGSISTPSSTFGTGEPGVTVLNTAAGATDLFLAKYYPY